MSSKRVPLQAPHEPGVPIRIAEIAYAEYERQYGSSQSFERLHERGGFGTIELMHLLCQRIVFVEERSRGASFKDAKELARNWKP